MNLRRRETKATALGRLGFKAAFSNTSVLEIQQKKTITALRTHSKFIKKTEDKKGLRKEFV